MPDNPKNLPGNGFLGWLGRQMGHVAKAVKADVTQGAHPPTVVFRADQVEQIPHPSLPGMMLRRTTVDEVVFKPPVKPPIE